MILSFWNKFSRRGKILLVSVLIAIIATGGTFAVLYETGILKFKADTITKNVTVTGKFTDAVTGQPVQNAKISVGAYGRTPANVITKADGSYRAVLTINAADPMQSLISIKEDHADYPYGENSYYTEMVPDSASTNIAIAHDIQVTKVLPSPSTGTVSGATPAPLDPTSQKCRGINDPDIIYLGKIINGVLFCVYADPQSDQSNVDVFGAYKVSLQDIANQIHFLEGQTGLTFSPYKILIKKKNADYAGEFVASNQTIVLTNDSLSDTGKENLKVITHEFGHFVDFKKGFIADRSKCAGYGDPINPGSSTYQCYASNYIDFTSAFMVNKKTMINDACFIDCTKADSSGHYYRSYASSNPGEMFAEFFEAMFADHANILNDGEKIKYFIKNASFTYSDTFKWRGSSLNLNHPDPKSLNAAMYIYKFVAKFGNTNEYFPGLVKRWTYDNIRDGKYMSVGVVPIRILDQEDKDLGNTDFTINGVAGKTRFPKNADGTINLAATTNPPYHWAANCTVETDPDYCFFGDHSPKNFLESGTEVLMNVPPGLDKIVTIPAPPNYFVGAESALTKRDIVQGANPVIDFSYRINKVVGIDYLPPLYTIPTNGVSGSKTIYMSNNGTKTAYPIVKGKMLRYPELGTSNGTVDVDKNGQLFFVIGNGTLIPDEPPIPPADYKVETFIFGSGGRTRWDKDLDCGRSYSTRSISGSNIIPGQNMQMVCTNNILNLIPDTKS